MKRAIATVAIWLMTALIAVPVSAGPAPFPPPPAPGAGAAAGQAAEADWVKIKGKSGKYYFAFAERMIEGGTAMTIAGVGKGDCTVSKSKHFTMIMCEGSGRAKEIPTEDFTLDPVLASASMKVTLGKTTHQASWTASDDAPTTYAGQAVGPFGAEAAGGMARDATATGTLFGKKLTPAGEHFAYLVQGAGAGVSTRTTRIDRRKGIVHAKIRFRIPR